MTYIDVFKRVGQNKFIVNNKMTKVEIAIDSGKRIQIERSQ